jgi:nucleoside-diphosphate-sugar epimerase
MTIIKYFITDGAGFMGSHLVNWILREHPAKIVVVDNFFIGYEIFLHQIWFHLPI